MTSVTTASQIRVAAAAGHFGRDVAFNLRRIEAIVREAAADGVDLLALPHGALSGYHDHVDVGDVDVGELGHGPSPRPDLPVAHRLDGPEVAAVVAIVAAVGGPVVCLGLTEDHDGDRANTALCLGPGGERLGLHRKVHLPAGEVAWYRPGDGFAAVTTPVARLGLMVDYDKTFPESARCLALDGAEVLVCPSAWPASRTNRAQSLARDRQRRLFDLYDRARAAENQLWLVSANQTGRHGAMRFLGQSKVVRPDGEIVAAAGARAGLAVADIELGAGIERARRRFHHLKERRPDLYCQLELPARPGDERVGEGPV